MKRWTIVLVSPQEPGNLGGIARVAKNFGVSSIRVVDPRCEVHGEDSRRYSAGAAELLRRAKIYTTLAEALADFEITIGLTGISGKHHRLDNISLLPRDLLKGKEGLKKCALVFGREDRGMESEELEACHYLWSLPTRREFPSLNLAQAVGITLASVAEVEREQGLTELGIGIAASGAALNVLAGSPDPGDRPATHAEIQMLEENLREYLLAIGWDESRRLVGSISKIRNILTRAGATEREVNLLHGIFRRGRYTIDTPKGEDIDKLV